MKERGEQEKQEFLKRKKEAVKNKKKETEENTEFLPHIISSFLLSGLMRQKEILKSDRVNVCPLRLGLVLSQVSCLLNTVSHVDSNLTHMVSLLIKCDLSPCGYFKWSTPRN